MARNQHEAGNRNREPCAPRPRSRLFTVRLWTEEGDVGSSNRGCVRDVMSGAFRHFRDWSELSAFMVARMEDEEGADSS
jgi:hypothetical protein